MSLICYEEFGVSDVSARMSRGCYEETAPVEFQLYTADTDETKLETHIIEINYAKIRIL